MTITTCALNIYSLNSPNIQCYPIRRPPDTLPILGNAIHFLKPRHVLFDWFVKCQQRFGKETFQISVPSLPPGVVINSAENLEFVLKNEASITKGDFFRERSWDLFGMLLHLLSHPYPFTTPILTGTMNFKGMASSTPPETYGALSAKQG